MAASIRQQKVASQIQRIVATVLLRDVADPRIDGLVSVTRVEVTPDLREAQVHISVLAGKRTPETVIEGIRSAARHIQGEVASGLALRFVPHLSFHLDDSLKKEAEIFQKIDEAVGRKPPAAPADED
jgi:ribosome-binding factor A